MFPTRSSRCSQLATKNDAQNLAEPSPGQSPPTNLSPVHATTFALFLAAAVVVPTANACSQSATGQAPLKVFILMGQSNMVGFGKVAPDDGQGTLGNLCKTQGKYAHLLDAKGEWAVRNDVWCVKTTVGQKQGWLSPGFGANQGLIGPELQFGHVIGDLLDEPVLIIKASQGNRSLGWDILPPGSEQFEHEGQIYAGYKDTTPSWPKGGEQKPVNWYAGKQYDDFVRDAKEVLQDLPKFFPDYDGRGYEIAGFGWWQGHKDQNAAHAGRYEQNLVHLIHSLRRDFAAPKAKFAIATIGFEGERMQGHALTILNAQLAVSGEAGKYPEFAGNVRSMDIRKFWRDKAVSPTGQGHHYNHNAETVIEVGNALGVAMAEMLTATPEAK